MSRIVFLPLLAIFVVAMSGCAPSANAIHFPVMPAELADCKTYMLNAGDGSNLITVMRCPNSSTTTSYRSGKSTNSAVVIDGTTYTPAADTVR